MITTNDTPKKPTTKLTLEPGMNIALKHNGAPLAAEQLGGKNLIVTKSGNSLMVTMPDGSQIELVDFYITDDVTLQGDFWDISADSGLMQTATGVTVQPAERALEVDKGVLGAEAIATDAVAEVVAESASASLGGVGVSEGVFDGLVALALSGGGGGAASSAFGTLYIASAFAGPMIDGGVGSTVAVYKASGNDAGQLLGKMAYDSSTGTYRYLDETNFTGIVVIKMVDGDAAPDYVSEATGKEADFGIGTVLMSVTSVDSLTKTVHITLTPLTTAAAKSLGVSATEGTNFNDPINFSKKLDGQIVVDTNKALAIAFDILDADGKPGGYFHAHGQYLGRH